MHIPKNNIRFDDGAGYEQTMGVWSQLAGGLFLDWLAPPSGWRWIDIGCGNGAFTELLVDRCAPREVRGIDTSEEQLAFARARPAAQVATFHQGNAMALPYPAQRFDAAIMALVIVFIADPAEGIREMARVVHPGGTVAAYVWDMMYGGFALEPILAEMRAMGLTPPAPPQMNASRLEMLRALWEGAGLHGVGTRVINVSRTFANFDEFWNINRTGPTVGPVIAAQTPGDVETLKRRVRANLVADTAGTITCYARANAIKGRVVE